MRTSHVCSDCGTHHPKWLGQCSGCGAYGTLTEETLSSGLPTESHPGSPRPVSKDARPPVAIADVVTAAEAACATGIAEFDRTLSGG
ncbi:DNA repair protein RadA, partial [bacterium LRH843]|nr:DNA repair protein RadA [bacterium LRH843]